MSRVYKFLILLFVVSCSLIKAGDHMNKTFIRSQPIRGVGEEFGFLSSKDSFLATRVTGFSRFSFKDGSLGGVLGFNGDNKISIGAASSAHIAATEFLHTFGSDPTVEGNIVLEPSENNWGVIFQVEKRAGKSPLFVGCQIPIFHMQRNINVSVEGEKRDESIGVGCLEYFTGSFSQPDGANHQWPLHRARMNTNGVSTDGLGDLTCYIGKHLFEDDSLKCCAYIDLVIPAHKDEFEEALFSDFRNPVAVGGAQKLFEPVIGNGGHVALGVGLNAIAWLGNVDISGGGGFKNYQRVIRRERIVMRNGVKVRQKMWCRERVRSRINKGRAASVSGGNVEVGLSLGLHGRIFRRADEWRTLGLQFVAGEDSTIMPSEGPSNTRPWGHYLLGARQSAVGFFPLANVLTKKVEVRPGYEVSADVALVASSRPWSVRAGYGAFLRGEEKIVFFDSTLEKCFYDNPSLYDGRLVWGGSLPIAEVQERDTKQVKADTESALVPSVFTHKFHIGAEFCANRPKVKIHLEASCECSESPTVPTLFQFCAGVNGQF